MIIHCYLENDFSRNKDSSTQEKRSRIITDFHYGIILRTHKTNKEGGGGTQICIKGDEKFLLRMEKERRNGVMGGGYLHG